MQGKISNLIEVELKFTPQIFWSSNSFSRVTWEHDTIMGYEAKSNWIVSLANFCKINRIIKIQFGFAFSRYTTFLFGDMSGTATGTRQGDQKKTHSRVVDSKTKSQKKEKIKNARKNHPAENHQSENYQSENHQSQKYNV